MSGSDISFYAGMPFNNMTMPWLRFSFALGIGNIIWDSLRTASKSAPPTEEENLTVSKVRVIEGFGFLKEQTERAGADMLSWNASQQKNANAFAIVDKEYMLPVEQQKYGNFFGGLLKKATDHMKKASEIDPNKKQYRPVNKVEDILAFMSGKERIAYRKMINEGFGELFVAMYEDTVKFCEANNIDWAKVETKIQAAQNAELQALKERERLNELQDLQNLRVALQKYLIEKNQKTVDPSGTSASVVGASVPALFLPSDPMNRSGSDSTQKMADTVKHEQQPKVFISNKP